MRYRSAEGEEEEEEEEMASMNGEEGGGSARAGRTPSAQRAGAEEAVEAAAPAEAEAMLMDEPWDEGSDGSMSDAIAPRRCGS